jgi:hypothetical protein
MASAGSRPRRYCVWGDEGLRLGRKNTGSLRCLQKAATTEGFSCNVEPTGSRAGVFATAACGQISPNAAPPRPLLKPGACSDGCHVRRTERATAPDAGRGCVACGGLERRTEGSYPFAIRRRGPVLLILCAFPHRQYSLGTLTLKPEAPTMSYSGITRLLMSTP